MKVRPRIKRIVGLTGTPASNGLMDLFAEYKAGTISVDDISLSDAVGILRIQKEQLQEKEEEYATEHGVSVDYVRSQYLCDIGEEPTDELDTNDDWLYEMEDYSEYLDDEDG